MGFSDDDDDMYYQPSEICKAYLQFKNTFTVITNLYKR